MRRQKVPPTLSKLLWISWLYITFFTVINKKVNCAGITFNLILTEDERRKKLLSHFVDYNRFVDIFAVNGPPIWIASGHWTGFQWVVGCGIKMKFTTRFCWRNGFFPAKPKSSFNWCQIITLISKLYVNVKCWMFQLLPRHFSVYTHFLIKNSFLFKNHSSNENSFATWPK